MLIMREQLSPILAPYSGQQGALIPILQEVQKELGYLPEEAISEIAQFVGLSDSEVYGVATFYAQFKFTPIGKKVVNVCRGTACHVRGADRILQELERQLGIKPGETTEDLEYSLESIACFGSCALAPVVVINKTVYGRMTPTKVRQILAEGKEQQ